MTTRQVPVSLLEALEARLVAADKVAEALEAWHDDAVRSLRRCYPKDEAKFRNMRDNYAALILQLRGHLNNTDQPA